MQDMTKSSATPARHKAGTPKSLGGRFKLDPNSEGASGLLSASRLDALRGDDFVPASAIGRDDGAERDIEEWHRRAFITAEHGVVPMMPDDFTPRHTQGRALSGLRRASRIKYKGLGTEVRMYSATNIRAFAQESGNKTFDIPVTAIYPGGDVQGTLRITPQGPGRWSVAGLGMSPEAAAYASEMASSVLEARSPSLALMQVKDVMARRKKRFSVQGVRMQATKLSKFIGNVGYDKAAGLLYVKMKGKLTYTYAASEVQYHHLMNATSPGEVYNTIKGMGKGRGHDVATCEKCGRCSPGGAAHRCPSWCECTSQSCTLPHGRELAYRNPSAAQAPSPSFKQNDAARKEARRQFAGLAR